MINKFSGKKNTQRNKLKKKQLCSGRSDKMLGPNAKHAEKIEKLLECGSNVGKNINILNHILPSASKSLIEISLYAYNIVTSRFQIDKSFNGLIVESQFENEEFDLVFTMSVLIHIHPKAFWIT